MKKLQQWSSTASGDDGATAVEYAVLASLVAAVIVTVVQCVGIAARDCFQALASVWH